MLWMAATVWRMIFSWYFRVSAPGDGSVDGGGLGGFVDEVEAEERGGDGFVAACAKSFHWPKNICWARDRTKRLVFSAGGLTQ